MKKKHKHKTLLLARNPKKRDASASHGSQEMMKYWQLNKSRLSSLLDAGVPLACHILKMRHSFDYSFRRVCLVTQIHSSIITRKSVLT